MNKLLVLVGLLVLFVTPVMAENITISDFSYASSLSAQPDYNYQFTYIIVGSEASSNDIGRRAYISIPLTDEYFNSYGVTDAYFKTGYRSYYDRNTTYMNGKVYVSSVNFSRDNITWNNQPCGNILGVIAGYCHEETTFLYEDSDEILTVNITEQVNYALEHSYPYAVVVLVDAIEPYGNGYGRFQLTGGLDAYVYMEGEALPISEVVVNRWDDLSSVGDEIGGFFYGLQALISFMLGLTIVVSIGVLFGTLFVFIATGVKSSFYGRQGKR
jgi:hypothetical protein